MNFKPYKNQDYTRIKYQHNSSYLFEDNEFPANSKSLFRKKSPPGINGQYIEWRRPQEMCPSPRFSVGGFDPKDLYQGRVGNCWYIAGAVDIATKPKYLDIVVPKDQSFDDGYSGVFHFRFWQFGEWLDVVVDDRLPVYNGALIYCSNRKDKNEFWGPLLEKAYAKLAGCYEYLDGGFTQDAIVDMTGGVTEYLDVKSIIQRKSKQSLWKFLYEAHKMGSLSGANIIPKNMEMEGKLANGLIVGHAYSITKIIEILPNKSDSHFLEVQRALSTVNRSQPLTSSFKTNKFEKPLGSNSVWDDDYGGGWDNDNAGGWEDNNANDYYGEGGNNVQPSNAAICLLRLRNPWGDHHEWKGAWSDSSDEWRSIDNNLKEKLGLKNEDDGEFWMNCDDFCDNFDIVCSVHVSLNAFMDEIEGGSGGISYKWDCKQYHDEWIPHKNAGGSGVGDYGSFWTNPQYLVNISKSANSTYSGYSSYASNDWNSNDNYYSQESESTDKSTLIVSLLSKDTNREANYGDIVSLPKQFRIYRVLNSTSGNSRQKFNSNDLERIGSSDVYAQFREVSMRFRLDPGKYVIIPSTYEQNIAGKFLLRLFTETSIQISEVSVLDIDDKNAVNIPDNNYNEIEDKLFDYIGKELLSLDVSGESGSESESEDSIHKKLFTLSERYSNLSSKINSAYCSVKKKKKSKDEHNKPYNECSLS